MERIISEGELRDLIGEIVVGCAGSADGTNVTREVKVIMRLVQKYSKEQDLVAVLDLLKKILDDTPEQYPAEGFDEKIAKEQDNALHDMYQILTDAIEKLKV